MYRSLPQALLVVIYFIFFKSDLSALSLSRSLARSGGSEPYSREKKADRHLQKDAPRHET
jgi:hypothetical protein